MPIFCVKSVKIYTGQKKITRAPPVAPVTNMRYAPARTVDLAILSTYSSISNPTSPLQYLLDVDFTLYECSVKHSIILIFQMPVRADF